MGIITVNPIPLTPTQVVQNLANTFAAQINGQYQQISNLFGRVFSFIWNNQQGQTPQQVFDLFGTNAGDLLKVANAFAAMVQTYTGTAPTLIPIGWTVTVNGNGSVTVTQGA